MTEPDSMVETYAGPLGTAHIPRVLLIEDEPGDAALIRWQLLERDPDAFSVQAVASLSEAEALLVTKISVSYGYDTTKAQSGTKTKIASFADLRVHQAYKLRDTDR